MTSRQSTGRLVGALYLGMAFFSALDITWFPGRFSVPGDPAATAARIASAPLLYRLWTVTELLAGDMASAHLRPTDLSRRATPRAAVRSS